MNKKIELLAPGGDIDSIKAAIAAGADAVYCGLDKFNARNRATNINFDDLQGILRLAHSHQCQVFITLNIVIVDSEIPAFISVLNKLVNTSVDGIILQDLGMLSLVSTYFKSLKIHASTQMTTHNKGQIEFLKQLSVERVNLSRELSLAEIKDLSAVAHAHDMGVEVFVHGSNCLSFSGLCYFSSVFGGNSGNRGRCSQPCRDQYLTTPVGSDFPLNLKDNSAFFDLVELVDAGVDSLKIEGRIKKFHYVYTVVDAWRKQLQHFYNTNTILTDNKALYSVFNRDFSNDFLKGNISKNLFIDNPRDHSAIYLSTQNGCENSLEKAKGDVYDERTEIIANVEQVLIDYNISKAPLSIHVSGKTGEPLVVLVNTPDEVFAISSDTLLEEATTSQTLDEKTIFERFKSVNDTEFFINKLDLNQLQPNLFIPFKELTMIKKQLLFVLNGSRELIEPVSIPALKKVISNDKKATLSVLILSIDDVSLCANTSASVYFKLPNSLGKSANKYRQLFEEHHELIPWFPSVLIGKDYADAVALLHQIKANRIVTDNVGIAFEAYKCKSEWIAGPNFNLVNSFSLAVLKEKFNCVGAFISNEIKKSQIKAIKKPENFELLYSLYHRIELMTSRQCLFHQVVGCEKTVMDDGCLPQCQKSTFMTNFKGNRLILEKQIGCYHTMYHEQNYLNTEIVTDLPNFFSNFLIDLTDSVLVKKTTEEKLNLINLFEDLLNGDSEKALHDHLAPTTCTQYRVGI